VTGDSKYTLVALPLNFPLKDISGGNGASAKDVWFDYDNAVLQQDHVLEVIDATTGRCASGVQVLNPATDSSKSGKGVKSNPGDHSVNLEHCGKGAKAVFPGKDDYIIFHVVNWDSSNSSLKVTKQN
jgi:hypothetical protein